MNPEKLPPPGTYPDFLSYIAEKLEMSVDAASVKNRAGYIVEAIRENYQNPELQKQRQIRAEKAKEKELEDLTTEFNVTPLTVYQKGGWLPRRSIPFLPQSSVRTCSLRLLKRMRMRRRGFCDSCQWAAVSAIETLNL